MGYLIHMQSPADFAEQLEAVIEDIFAALRHGLVLAQQVHTDNHWESEADMHLFLHLVRRETVERLRSSYDATAEPGDNLGLPMSGIVLAMPSNHVLRVWHSSDGEIPPATSIHRRTFCHQMPSGLGGLVPLPQFAVAHDQPSNLAILWDHRGDEIVRLDLVRPMGLDNKKALIDWRHPLLPSFQRVSDLDYGRADADKNESAEADADRAAG